MELLYCSEHYEKSRGSELLLQVKEVETTTTLLSSIQSSCAESCPEVIEDYNSVMRSPELTLQELERLEFDALGALLGLDGEYVMERAGSVRKSLSEWRNPELLFRYLEDNKDDEEMYELIKRWLRAIFGLSRRGESLRMIRRESDENVRHLLMIPQEILLRWYAEDCPGTSKCKTLFMLGEDAGSCLRIISNDGNKYNRALMGYVLQSHVRALVVADTVGRVMCRSLIRLVLRSDTLTPVIFCDPMFFTLGYSRDLQRELLQQARALEEQMQIPVVHAGSVLPVVDCVEDACTDGELAVDLGSEAIQRFHESGQTEDANGLIRAADEEGGPPILDRTRAIEGGGYVRRVAELDYDVTWVELIEMDGVSPYTYSEELPYDDLLQQHTPGVQSRNRDDPTVVVAALPRADSPSAKRYVAEREGETAWTMHLSEKDAYGVEKLELPPELARRIAQREHVGTQVAFDPNARKGDEDYELPSNYRAPSLDE